MEKIRAAIYLLTAGVALALAVAFVLPHAPPSPVVSDAPVPQRSTAEATSVLPTPEPVATTTPSQVQPVVASTTPHQPKKLARALSTPTAAISAATPVASSASALLSQDEIDSRLAVATALLRTALVNIICYASPGSGVRSISGSGVLIDPKGVILTNAHIAQYFLLTGNGVSCKVRTGSPAADQYSATLVYIPSQWVRDNAGVLTTYQPIGTGERDFALVAITDTLTSTALPVTFPFLPLEEGSLVPGAPVVIGSYGAQFLQASQIQSALSQTLVFGSVKAVYTFAKNTIDVLALGGSAAAQEGSSGGGVVDVLGNLAGTLTTSTIEGDTGSRELNAISSAYIAAEFARESGRPLETFLRDPVETQVTNFASTAHDLTSTLLEAIRS